MAGCLASIPPEWIEDLGNWVGSSTNKTSAAYIRTHLARVRSIQCSVAEAARENGKLDEEELWSSFTDFRLKHEVAADDVVEQVVELAVILSRARASHAKKQSDAIAAAVPVQPDVAEQPDAVDDEWVEEAPVTPSHWVHHEAPDIGTFVVSIRQGFKRLHRVGDCHLVPGKDYSCFETLGPAFPSTERFDAPCKWCFKGSVIHDAGSSSDCDSLSS